MPGIVKVKILEGRNLPVMDKSADTTDAYVELKLGNITYKTEVCRKSLNPQWNSEWYRFEMDDAELQDEPLQVRLMDHDTYSANDMIGKIYFNLNPLLLMAAQGVPGAIERSLNTSPRTGNISGWFPVYDTIHGLRGELNLIIKLDLFSDLNKFRQSSCGVHIFSASIIPHGYYAEQTYGFVEELVVEDDPEYQWIEKIRTPRASNEARQAMFYKMSGELQRKIGLKVIEFGGNAIIGYRQCYDLEGESGGVVVRATGTAVKLNKYRKMDFRPSLFKPQFKIPDLIITSVCDYNNTAASDSCSIISLTDSVRSENLFGYTLPEDRWSLCSFASRISCNSSRYTSIETLLDQSNRKPIKSNSKLLSVAKYFSSSRLRNKLASKKKHKSLSLRKFSVIEENKQKGVGSESVILDRENTRANHNSFAAQDDEKLSIFEKSDQHKSKYFNAINYHPASAKCTEKSTKSRETYTVDYDSRCVEDAAVRQIEARIVAVAEKDPDSEAAAGITNQLEQQRFSIQGTEESLTSFDNENTRCESFEDKENKRTYNLFEEDVDGGNGSDTVSTKLRRSNSFLLAVERDELLCRSSTRKSISSKCSSSGSVTSPNSTAKKKDDEKYYAFDSCVELHRAINSVRTHKPGVHSAFERCQTPPISKMTPYQLDNEKNKKLVKNVGFGPDFLKSLHRNELLHDFDTAAIANSCRENNYNPVEQVISSSGVSDKNDVSSEHTDRVDTESTPTRIDIAAAGDSQKYNSTCCISYNDNYPVKAASSCNDNINRCITAAADKCNISSEASTSNCLLSHANLNRNTSEGDKDEEDPSKRETAVIQDTTSKPRTASENATAAAAAGAKCAELTKENEISFPDIIDGKGINLVRREHIELMEYPFFTLSGYPEDFILHLGGTVSARSVKLLGRISNVEEPETRDAWWNEIRIEIKAHMRALACNAVLNYQEKTSICDEVCVLSATGTAAVIKIFDGVNNSIFDDTTKVTTTTTTTTTNRTSESEPELKDDRLTPEDSTADNCAIFHIPYRKSSVPFPVKLKVCEICRKEYVPDVLFVTVEPPDRFPVIGQSAFVYAFAYRLKRDCKSELNAREISDGLPFLEYDLNRQLLNKVRIKGMNAIFGLEVQVSIGDKMILAYATGSAVLLAALSIPPELNLVAHGRWHQPNSRKKLSDAKKHIEDTIRKNKLYYQLTDYQPSQDISNNEITMVSDHGGDMEYGAGLKQTCVIEVDDEDDIESISQLIDPNPPQGFLVSATERMIFGNFPYVPKKNFHLFAQVYRYRISNNTLPSGFNKLFYRIVQALYVKIHNKIPCSLDKVTFKMDIPEPDELQIRIVGMAIALKESEKAFDSMSTSCSSVSELADDFFLNADTEKEVSIESSSSFTPRKIKQKNRGDIVNNDIHVTSLSYIPGATIISYLGYLNFVFIRESTMVKEQSGGVNNFVNNFILDVTSMVKSHAAGIGGNAVVNFFLNECVLITHSHKNQGQCLVNVGGDVIRFIYKKTA